MIHSLPIGFMIDLSLGEDDDVGLRAAAADVDAGLLRLLRQDQDAHREALRVAHPPWSAGMVDSCPFGASSPWLTPQPDAVNLAAGTACPGWMSRATVTSWPGLTLPSWFSRMSAEIQRGPFSRKLSKRLPGRHILPAGEPQVGDDAVGGRDDSVLRRSSRAWSSAASAWRTLGLRIPGAPRLALALRRSASAR